MSCLVVSNSPPYPYSLNLILARQLFCMYLGQDNFSHILAYLKPETCFPRMFSKHKSWYVKVLCSKNIREKINVRFPF